MSLFDQLTTDTITFFNQIEDSIHNITEDHERILSQPLFLTLIKYFISDPDYQNYMHQGLPYLIMILSVVYTYYTKTRINISCYNSIKQRCISFFIYAKTPIHFLAEMDNNNLLEDLISRKYSDINKLDNCGKTPLHISAERGNTFFGNLLLKGGADIQVKTSGFFGSGKTPLHLSAEKGHKDFVELLVQWKASINEKTKFCGKTALHLCVENGHNEIADVLLAAGADVNLHDYNNRTVLHISACSGNKKLVQSLLERGADINKKDDYGRTALHYCAAMGYNAIVDLLLKYKASPNIRDALGEIPLHYAAVYEHPKTVSTLVKFTDFIDTENYWNRTALHYSTLRGHTEVVTTLLETGAGVDVIDYYGKTPLHYSAEGNTVDVMKVLIQHGANLDIADTSGQTALEVAIQNSNDDAVAILKRHGAELLKQKRNKFMTPLRYIRSLVNEIICYILRVLMHFTNTSLSESFRLCTFSTPTEDENKHNFGNTGIEVSASEDTSYVQKEIGVTNTTPTTRLTTNTTSTRTPSTYTTLNTYTTSTANITPTSNTSQTTTPITCITSTQSAWAKTGPSNDTTAVFTNTTAKTTDATSATEIKSAVETKIYQTSLYSKSTHIKLSEYNSRILKNTRDNSSPVQESLTQTKLETFGENRQTFFEKHELLDDAYRAQENASVLRQTNDKQDVMVKRKKTSTLKVAKQKKRRGTKNNIIKNYNLHCRQMIIDKVDYLTTNGNQNFY